MLGDLLLLGLGKSAAVSAAVTTATSPKSSLSTGSRVPAGRLGLAASTFWRTSSQICSRSK